jgi:hypothetical protein
VKRRTTQDGQLTLGFPVTIPKVGHILTDWANNQIARHQSPPLSFTQIDFSYSPFAVIGTGGV